MTNSSVGFPQFYQIQQILDRFLTEHIAVNAKPNAYTDARMCSYWIVNDNFLQDDAPMSIPTFCWVSLSNGISSTPLQTTSISAVAKSNRFIRNFNAVPLELRALTVSIMLRRCAILILDSPGYPAILENQTNIE